MAAIVLRAYSLYRREKAMVYIYIYIYIHIYIGGIGTGYIIYGRRREPVIV